MNHCNFSEIKKYTNNNKYNQRRDKDLFHQGQITFLGRAEKFHQGKNRTKFSGNLYQLAPDSAQSATLQKIGANKVQIRCRKGAGTKIHKFLVGD